MRKLFSLFLALLATTALWAHDFEVNGLFYSFKEGTNEVAVTYKGPLYSSFEGEYSGEIVIPESVTYDGSIYRVTEISGCAFEKCKELTSVTIPNSVKTIGSSAFYFTPSLTTVIMGDSVTSIGPSAFMACAVEDIELPYGITSIASQSFAGCNNLSSIVIPNSVTSIQNDAFASCTSLTSIVIPNSVKTIGNSILKNCKALTSITFPNSITKIGNNICDDCYSLFSITWNAVQCADAISFSPFADIANQITSFTFGENVEYIPSRLCYNMTNLTSITIPKSVTNIGNSAFGGCTSLNSVTYTGNVASWCNIKFGDWSAHPNFHSKHFYIDGKEPVELVIAEEINEIQEYTFYNWTKLAKVTLHENVTSIGANAFGNCKQIYDIYCHAVESPTAHENSFANYNVNLYVPCESLQDYQMDAVFGAFKYIQCLDEVVVADELPVVALYDWLLMLNVNEINEMGYYFSLSDVSWYRVVGEPDDIYNNFPLDDQLLAEGSSYLTLDQNLNGTGNYYAVVEVNGTDTENLLRSEIISYSGRKQPAKLALHPNTITMGQSMLLSGLNPKENTEISVYSVTGQLVETRVSKGESTISLDATRARGLYQVLVKSASDTETLSYIVK